MRTLVIGVAGTGKSYLVERMKRMGLNAVDADDELAAFVDAKGNEVEYDPNGGNDWWKDHYFVLRVEKLRKILEDNSTVYVFGDVGGQPGKGNGLLDVLHLFDRAFYLQAPASLILERLASRTNNQFGKNPEEAEGVTRRKAEMDKIARKLKLDIVDATAPAEEVIKILSGPRARSPERRAPPRPAARLLEPEDSDHMGVRNVEI